MTNGISTILAAVREFGDQTEEYKALGNIKVIKQDDLLLFNYTEKATFERRWNAVERVSRGLIVDWKKVEVVARPMPKFFNLGEMPETEISALPTDGYVEVTDKLDGSLIIVSNHNGSILVNTRGSFVSEQAQWAQAQIEANPFAYKSLKSNRKLTYLFEAIYPENRIVLAYPTDKTGLYLIGIVDNETGEEPEYAELEYVSKYINIPLVPIAVVPVEDLPRQAAQAQGIEGWVVRYGSLELGFIVNPFRVKIKTTEYLRLHRLYSECNAKHILELMEADWDRAIEWINALPDDLLGIAKPLYTFIAGEYYSRESNAIFAFEATRHLLYESRKAFALVVTAEPYKEFAPYIFGLADNRDVRALILKDMRKWV